LPGISPLHTPPGKTLQGISRRYGTGRRKTAWIVRESGGTVRPGGKQGPDTGPDALFSAYMESRSLTLAAARFGISPASARLVLKKAGIHDLAAARFPPVSELRAAYESGLSLRTCGAKFGMTPATISQMLRRAGCQTRPAGTRRPVTAAEAAAIRAAWDAGMSLNQCAATFSCSQTAAARANRGRWRDDPAAPQGITGQQMTSARYGRDEAAAVAAWLREQLNARGQDVGPLEG
jgi:hypothetical protein